MRFLYILLVVLLFGILIAIHEFGHFFTAKLLGVKVNEFAIGMGPVLWQSKKGTEPWEGEKTLYSLRLFPIGGYCAMEGEDEDTGNPKAFARQAGWKKIIILCAGSFMNFLLGLVIMVALSLGTTQAVSPVIAQFADGFQHEGASGLMIGDRIVSVDGHAVWIYSDALTYLDRNDGVSGVDLVVERAGERIVLDDFPMTRSVEMVENGQSVMKFGLTIGAVEELSIPGRVKLGFLQSVDFVRIVWMSLGDLVTGRVPVSELSGVIGVVDVVSEQGAKSETAALGILNVLSFMALIAVNLAVMNMLPIPALDGGRVFFVLLNGLLYLVVRRRIPEKYEGYVHAGAFVVLLALMAVVALHDVWNIFA